MSKRLTRRAGLTALAAGGTWCALAITVAPKLVVRMDGDYVHISAPRLNFLNGKALERLKDGVSIAFIGQLTVTSSPNAVVADARSIARFALSYDIWDEHFSVTRFGERPGSQRTISHLSAQAAETWCLDNLAVEQSLMRPDRPFYVQLDLRADDPRDQIGVIGEPGINITRLIEIFSRPVKGNQQRWLLNAGPFTIAELKKARYG
ncbi:MAG: hypothetical protein ABUS51_02660 [Acidobacteriota bacterium]